MEKLIDGFTNQLRSAIRTGLEENDIKNDVEILNIVICGMGASGIGGDIIFHLYKNRLDVPVEVVKGYHLPNYVSKNTLVIASSYSGNTEETMACLEEAQHKNAIMSVVTSGGKLLTAAREMSLSTIVIPGGTDCPRANVGYSLTALLFTLYRFGLISNSFISEIEFGAKIIEDEKVEIKESAKEIAKILKDKIPIIYSENILYPVSLRFQQQINENSKQLAHVNVFPEMNHNELVGWVNPKEIFDKVGLVYLRTDQADKAVNKRLEICKEIFTEKSDTFVEIKSKGASMLEKYIYLFFMVDNISYFLALENKVDPFPVEKIDYLKSKLV